MDQDIALVEKLDFSIPPIREVTLSIFHDAIFELTSTVAVLVLLDFSETYPVLEDAPPQTPWDPSIQARLEESITADQHWPSPLFSASTEDRVRTIRLQEDRFELVWRFDPDRTSAYIGFEGLKNELLRQFEKYKQLLTDVADVTAVEVKRTDATYRNILDIAPLDYCTGLLNSWNETPVREDLKFSQYAGMRFNNPVQVKDSFSLVAIDPLFENTATNLFIDVQVPSPDGTIEASLELAHSIVLTSFERFTSPAMRVAWGEVK